MNCMKCGAEITRENYLQSWTLMCKPCDAQYHKRLKEQYEAEAKRHWTKTGPTEPGDYWFVAAEVYGPMILVEVIYSQFKDPDAPAVLCAVTPQGYMWPVSEPRGYWWPERVERPPDGPTWENGRYVFKGAALDVVIVEVTG